MEDGASEADAAPDAKVKPVTMACLRRQAWAKSRDSIGQESKPEPQGPPEPQPSQSPSGGDTQGPSEEPGQVPHNIASWLIECRTPLGASLDDQSPSPSKGVLRNCCSFEDDLSLGAEANHLLANNSKTESCFGLAADQKRSQYKERGRSMNSTGSGKSSTVSSVSEKLEQSDEPPVELLLTLRVSELLDLYEEDPEEILFNLGFGREEPDLNAKIPSRFFSNTSSARGIDIKVYLRAQLQRVELENPNYALTSRFRQIEVLTTVANEFFQLYSQVSGQPVQRISSKEQDDGGDEGRGEERPPPLKKTNSALNVAKLLKKTLSKHNLLSASSESPDSAAQQNGRSAATAAAIATATPAASNHHAQESGHAQGGSEQEERSTDSDHKAEAAGQKVARKKDNCSLATVTEETSGDGESDRPSENSPEASGGHSAEEGGAPPVPEEETQTSSTQEKAPPTLTPPHLAQLRTENTDSFDMEEIQSNEDEAPPPRTHRASDLLRTVSQQSDSSGFAEEPSTDFGSYLKVQDSSDSCDSETTVTSHLSQDVTTPIALDQPAFNLPDVRQEEAGLNDAGREEAGLDDAGMEEAGPNDVGREEAGPNDAGREEAGPNDVTETDGRSVSQEEKGDGSGGSSEQIPQYTVHHLPKLQPTGVQEEEKEESQDQDPAPEPELEPEPEPETNQILSTTEQEQPQELEESVSGPDPEHTEEPSQREGDTTEGGQIEDLDQAESLHFNDPDSPHPPAPSSRVLSALNRARQNQLSRMGQGIDHQGLETSASPGKGRGGRGSVRLQRSSSLPSSLVPSSRVVSSVKIQFGRGQASCSQPRYSVKYPQEDEEEEELREEGGRSSVLSTLIINPAPNKKPPTAGPPKPIPSYLMRSSQSLHSSSPPPEWSPGAQSWSTQSVPDLSSNQPAPQFPPPNQNQNPGFAMFSNCSPSVQYFDPSPSPSPRFSFAPYASSMNTHPHYHSNFHPYTSLPNLHHPNPSMHPHPGLTSLHHRATPPVPAHHSMSNFHQPPNPSVPDHAGLGHQLPGSTALHPQGFNHPYASQPPYFAPPPSAPSHFVFQGHYVNSHLQYPPTVCQYPPLLPPAAPSTPPHPHIPSMIPDHNLYSGLAQSAPGFHPGLAPPAFSQAHHVHSGMSHPAAPGSGLGPAQSSTEVQLRRVLHEIRGTVQSLSENRVDTPDTFSEHRAGLPNPQSLGEFQQKRRSLNMFRRQMMDLELSIIQQQALVYNHLSPADRMEVEKLQSLRSNVREELQELEQQLEERLMELIHNTQHPGLHSNSSVDNFSTNSALRAMEPMSDLLSEQLSLQSELSYDGHDPPTRSSTPGGGGEGGGGGGGGRRRDSEQKQGLYRASVDITPSLPPRPNTHNKEEQRREKEEEEEDRERRDNGGVEEEEERGEGGGASEEEGAAGGVKLNNLQQLIKEIRESVAQEVRKEIYGELLAAVTPQQSLVSSRQHRP